MRIAIVNDTALAVEALRRVITSVARYQIAWIARDGAEAVDRAAQDTPDLLLMDIHMPQMDGVQAIRQIMSSHPCPILVVTSTVKGHAGKVFEALAAGAMDAVSTPVMTGDGQLASQQAFLAKIHTIERLVGRRHKDAPRDHPTNWQPTPRTTNNSTLVVIGASAGGPGAVAELLKVLPALFPPVVVVQHIDTQFAGGMADWLDGQTALKVHVARSNDALLPGNVYVAGEEGHLVMTRKCKLDYIADAPNSSYMPCIDTMLLSVAEYWEGRTAGVLLTGMGRDGAAGLKALREAGALTIAQDKDSSVVYGMPKAAAEIGAAEKILPLMRIASTLVQFAEWRGSHA